MFDVIIKNGKIIDGTGTAGYSADIAIKDQKIAAIGKFEAAQAKEIIDAAGALVTPGFIDMHSHADLTCFIYPRHESNLMQGVTSFVGGNCGVSIAPLINYWSILYMDADILNIDSPLGFDAVLPVDAVKRRFEEHFGVEIDWSSFPEYMDSMERRSMASNLIPAIGHGQVRAQVMGQDYKHPASGDEISAMQTMIVEALDAGAFGMSTGMDYAPGIYADFNELLGIVEPVRKREALYLSHWKRTGMRSGTPKTHRKIDGIIEQLELSRQTGVKLQLSHLSPGYEVFPNDNPYLNRAAAYATTQVIDTYNRIGARATFDVIPSTTGGLGIEPNLSAAFSKWLFECEGSAHKFSERLHANDYKQQIINFINEGNFYSINPRMNPDWAKKVLVIQSKHAEYIGKTLYQLANERGCDQLETALDLVADEYDIKVDSLFCSKEIVEGFLEHPLAMPSSDAVITDLNGPWRSSDEFPGSYPTPNGFCYTIKFLTEFPHISLEDAIRRMSGQAADILGFTDRGYLKPGAFADILVFKPDDLKTNESRVMPCVYPSGMKYVLVNGEITIKNGQHTGAMAGKIIRRKGKNNE